MWFDSHALVFTGEKNGRCRELGGGVVGGVQRTEPGTFRGRLFKRSETIPCPSFVVEAFRPNSSILLRENSRHDCVNQTAARIFRPHRPGKSRSRHLPPT